MPGYKYEGIACQVYSASGSGRKALMRAFNNGNGDHFYTTDLSEHAAAINSGAYSDEHFACWVLPPELEPGNIPQGVIPLMRAFHKGTGDHFYTTSSDELHNAISGGYTYEGNACFVPESEVLGTTTPFFRLYSNSNGDHFYTIYVAERDFARAPSASSGGKPQLSVYYFCIQEKNFEIGISVLCSNILSLHCYNAWFD